LLRYLQQNNLKEYQLETETARASREELASANKELEKKFKALEAEFLRQQQELTSSERVRKDLQAERDELAEELSSASRYLLTVASFVIYTERVVTIHASYHVFINLLLAECWMVELRVLLKCLSR
jgi:predicted nuclease with TOPRIM domain